MLLIIGALQNFIVTGQSLWYSVGLPYLNLSAYSTKQTDVFSFTGNQAALANKNIGGVGIYGERRFLIAENSVYGLAAAVPSMLGNFGVQVNYAGFQNFNEQKVGLAYGRSLGDKVDVGIQFNYYGYKIPAYQNGSAINFEGGAIFHFSEKLNAGVHVYNPVGGTVSKANNEKLAAVYKFGLGYDASDNFYVSTEIVKEENQPINVTGGFQYTFKKQFFARAGFRSDNNTGYSGVGFLYNKLRIDVAASFHPQLGVSPAILLIYNFKEMSK
ncbi:MAG: hypothetical protein H7320_22120 [Ferruginibacter sp.]|nr:hypothetical protein [Ferruginibacter sp.]